VWVIAVNSSILIIVWQDSITRAIDNVYINNHAFDQTIPVVIVLRAQEYLVDSSINKSCSICIILYDKYIVQEVCYILKPELIMKPYFFCNMVDYRFTCIINK